MLRVGIEHTDYFNDTLAGNPSPLSPVSDFWQRVQASLVRRISHRDKLTGLDARIRLNDGLLKGTNKALRIALAKQLASELVAFGECHPIELGRHKQWQPSDFGAHPTLHSAITSLKMARYAKPSGCVSRCNWTCSNTSCGNVGLSVDYVGSAIRAKNVTVVHYCRDHLQETWLVISAAGGTISNYAGPIQLSGLLDDPRIMSACQASPFERIAFWDRTHAWYRWLKPLEAAAQY
jgi:hypothetical protein